MSEISVTVPVYNVEKYLPRCLNSLINQTFKLNYDIICVDDGSTDNSGKILDDYAKKYPKIKVIHQDNQGLSVARNKALEYVTGKYTMFVDSDDFIANNTLESLYKYAEDHKSDVVIFDFLRGTPDCKNVHTNHFIDIIKKYGNSSFNAETAESFVYRFIPVATWSKFYLTDLIKNINFEKDLLNQDVPHWANVYTKAKRINYLPISFYYYSTQREKSITMNNSSKVFNVFKAFSLAEDILKKSGYFQKFKHIHYAHFTSNLVVHLQRLNPDIRKEMIDRIKSCNLELDYDLFDKDDFFPFEKENMKIIKFIRENNYENIGKFLINHKIWN